MWGCHQRVRPRPRHPFDPGMLRVPEGAGGSCCGSGPLPRGVKTGAEEAKLPLCKLIPAYEVSGLHSWIPRQILTKSAQVPEALLGYGQGKSGGKTLLCFYISHGTFLPLFSKFTVTPSVC